MGKVWTTVVELAGFRAFASRHLTEDQVREIVDLVARHSGAGVLIHGTGGIRKMRFAREGGGKSGGYRIVYFYHDPSLPVFLIAGFAKNVKENLSQAERNALKSLTKRLIQTYGERS